MLLIIFSSVFTLLIVGPLISKIMMYVSLSFICLREYMSERSSKARKIILILVSDLRSVYKKMISSTLIHTKSGSDRGYVIRIPFRSTYSENPRIMFTTYESFSSL